MLAVSVKRERTFPPRVPIMVPMVVIAALAKHYYQYYYHDLAIKNTNPYILASFSTFFPELAIP
jgi:hypothetical protein